MLSSKKVPSPYRSSIVPQAIKFSLSLSLLAGTTALVVIGSLCMAVTYFTGIYDLAPKEFIEFLPIIAFLGISLGLLHATLDFLTQISKPTIYIEAISVYWICAWGGTIVGWGLWQLWFWLSS